MSPVVSYELRGSPAEASLKVTQLVSVSSRPLCVDYSVDALSSQQGSVSTPPASSNSAVKKAMKKDSVIVHSTQITSGKLNKLDISFVPRTVSRIPLAALWRNAIQAWAECNVTRTAD